MKCIFDAPAGSMKKLIFTITNDITYDQRMIRICSSLARGGFDVTLIGRMMKGSKPLPTYRFNTKRITCVFSRGFLFYAEYNFRLFWSLLFMKADLLCAIDLDTILPIYYVSRLRRLPRVYDAHELFCEMKEISGRPRLYKFWKRVERHTVPHFEHGYTVNKPIADEFARMYGRHYDIIRSVAVYREFEEPRVEEKYILYQGAVNEGRSFETLIPAMLHVSTRLLIAGDGNFMAQAKKLVKVNGLEEKVIFLGKIEPEKLLDITRRAYIGITLFEGTSLSNYYSLANRFFDYLHAAVPQLCVDYPVYREINSERPIAVLTGDLRPENIARQLNLMLSDNVLYAELKKNCREMRQVYSWQNEEVKLLQIYQNLFRH